MRWLALLGLAGAGLCRCAPGEPCWPAEEEWAALNASVHGRLQLPRPPGEGGTDAVSAVVLGVAGVFRRFRGF